MPETKKGIVLRLSAEGAEQVKRALGSMGKDGADAMRRLERASREVPPALAAVDGAVNSTRKIVGGLIAAFSLQRVASQVRNVVQEAAEIGRVAEKIGIATDALQAFRFGLGRIGVDASATDRALAEFAKRIGEATAGQGQLAAVLQANGVALRDQQGDIRSVMDLLRDYANLMKGASSAQERLALADMAFGDAGRDMVLALQDGADSIDDLQRAATDAGVVLGGDLIETARRVDERFSELADVIGTQLKAAILDGVDAVYNFIDSFRALENRSSKAGLLASLNDLNSERDALHERMEALQAGKLQMPGIAGDVHRDELIANMQAQIMEIDRRSSAILNRIDELNQSSRPPVMRADRSDELPVTVLPTVTATGGTDRAAEREQRRLERLAETILKDVNPALAAERALKERLADIAELRSRGLLSETDGLAAASAATRDYAETLEKARQAALDAATDWQSGAIRALEDIARSAGTAADVMEQALTGAFDSASEAFDEFLQTGTFNFSKFAASILKDLARIAAKSALGGLSGILSQAFGGGAGASIGIGTGSFVSGVGAVGLYADGGIATRPSIFGEAGPEAAVPLPNGRSIPVDLRGALRAAAVEVHVNNYGARVETQPRPNGGIDINVFVEAVANNIRNGGIIAAAIQQARGGRTLK